MRLIRYTLECADDYRSGETIRRILGIERRGLPRTPAVIHQAECDIGSTL